jgi:hypothetical protein
MKNLERAQMIQWVLFFCFLTDRKDHHFICYKKVDINKIGL